MTKFKVAVLLVVAVILLIALPINFVREAREDNGDSTVICGCERMSS
jgi:hypothetical protein